MIISSATSEMKPAPAQNRVDEITESARNFEATFIAQVLSFSGLDKALTMGGGDSMSPFASFYIDALAEDMAENGGFGLAEDFYKTLTENDRK